MEGTFTFCFVLFVCVTDGTVVGLLFLLLLLLFFLLLLLLLLLLLHLLSPSSAAFPSSRFLFDH